METAKVFMNGGSQAVRIPKQYRFDADELFVNKIGEAVVLTPVSALAESFEKGLHSFSEDFLADGIPEHKPSERPEL